jgi:hypothetical protein
MASRRKPGLWFSNLSAEVQAVKPAHKLPCCECAAQPALRRLVVKKGGGRRGETFVYCEDCGRAWFHNKAVEAERAKDYLRTGEGEIRSL